MTEFDKIHLVWRKGTGGRRHSVGILERQNDGKITFQYDSNLDKLKKEEGFVPYTEFQDTNKIYNGNVVDIFGQRLMKVDRPDAGFLFDFWEVDKTKVSDKFYLLGKTQGLVPTDNFEFLAEYKLTPDIKYLTEVAGNSIYKIEKGVLKLGDKLRYELEPENEFDKYAVGVFKGDIHLGYIKKYHNQIFHQPGAEKLQLEVKGLEQNGFLKRVFVKVSF